MVNWLYHLTIDVSLLVGLVLILRGVVRHTLGANVAYWLWLIPFIRLFFVEKIESPLTVAQWVETPQSTPLIQVFKNPDALIMERSIPLIEIWMAGLVLFFLYRFLLGFVFYSRLKKVRVHAELPQELKQATKNWSQIKRINIYQLDQNISPFVSGIFKPAIYLPADFFETHSHSQQKLILTHELKHIERKDLWGQLAFECLRMILWFNPIVHLAKTAFNEDQELACDHKVLSETQLDVRHDYAKALMQSYHVQAFPAIMAFFNNHKERFIMLEKHENSKFKNVLGLAMCLTVMVFALTKSPEILAQDDTTDDQMISFQFNDIPIKDVLSLAFLVLEKEVKGMDQLGDAMVSVDAQNVSAKDFATVVLNCYHMDLVDEKSHYQIVKKETASTHKDSPTCVKDNLKKNGGGD